MPTSIALTRTFGAHSTASDRVSESTPALAAPYAAVPGEGRSAETDEMLTIDAAALLPLHHRVRGLRDQQRREQVELDDLLRGSAATPSAAGDVRRSPGVVHQHVEPPVAGRHPVDQLADRLGLAHVADVVAGPRHRLAVGARAGDDGGTRRQEGRA